MTLRGLSYPSSTIFGRATGATGRLGRLQFCGGYVGAIGFAFGAGKPYRITSAPMRDTVAKAVGSRQRVGDAQQTGGKEMCEEQAVRMKNLEDAVARQASEIDALNSLVADLMVAHAMSTGDARPLTALREYADFAHKRFAEGGTSRIPAIFFEARCEAFVSVLQNVSQSELPTRYWVRSAWGWLDNRRYEANLRLRKAIERIADWPL